MSKPRIGITEAGTERVKQSKPLCHDKAHMALDLVEEAERKLRHAAHVFHTTDERVRSGLDVVSMYNERAVDALYRAARALVAAELIRDTQETK